LIQRKQIAKPRAISAIAQRCSTSGARAARIEVEADEDAQREQAFAESSGRGGSKLVSPVFSSRSAVEEDIHSGEEAHTSALGAPRERHFGQVATGSSSSRVLESM